ncbi:MAG: hypothetical protein ACREHV_11595, partial [Rhizomicrobium sp.]
DASDAEWFSCACRKLFDGKAGTALHYLTGFDERSCQRYAAGQVKPPAYFLRALLRGEQGNIWLNAVMDGASPKWWREHAITERKAALFEQARTILSQLQ